MAADRLKALFRVAGQVDDEHLRSRELLLQRALVAHQDGLVTRGRQRALHARSEHQVGYVRHHTHPRPRCSTGRGFA